MVEAETIAYGELGLTPDEFGELCPAEFRAMVRGARKREEREWQRLAWQTAHQLNISGKSTRTRITPAKLLGKSIRSSNDEES